MDGNSFRDDNIFALDESIVKSLHTIISILKWFIFQVPFHILMYKPSRCRNTIIYTNFTEVGSTKVCHNLVICWLKIKVFCHLGIWKSVWLCIQETKRKFYILGEVYVLDIPIKKIRRYNLKYQWSHNSAQKA